MTTFLAPCERSARSDQDTPRRGAPAHDDLAFAILSGRRYPLSQDIATIGRPTDALPLIWQAELRARSISRLHLLISRNFNAIDLRSLFGTTVNGEFLGSGDHVTPWLPSWLLPKKGAEPHTLVTSLCTPT
jgi:hypothetical protein